MQNTIKVLKISDETKTSLSRLAVVVLKKKLIASLFSNTLTLLFSTHKKIDTVVVQLRRQLITLVLRISWFRALRSKLRDALDMHLS